MKNRNDDRKLVFQEQKKKLVDRLFSNIQKINNRKINDHPSNRTTLNHFYTPRLHNYKDIQQIRKYEINKENQRMVQRICMTKHTVIPHVVPKPKAKRTELTKILQRKNLQQQNQRLRKVINKASPSHTHSLRCYSSLSYFKV